MSKKKDWKKTDSEFSDADVDQISATLTDEDLRERSQALHNAQEIFEELAYLANPKIPCPECSGSGSISGGSLGDLCVRCFGTRVIDHPGSHRVEMPPFAQIRAAINAYGDAVADRALPGDHLGKRNLALPAASTVPTLESIKKLSEDGLTKARQLQGAPGVVAPHLLAEAKKARGLAGEGDLGGYEDGELDVIEDEAKEV